MSNQSKNKAVFELERATLLKMITRVSY